MLKQKVIFIYVLGVLFFLSFSSGCKTGAETVENPIPVIDTVSPWARAAHLPSFTLTVTGSDFKPGASINFNGIARDTVYNSGTELTCTIQSSDLQTNPSPDSISGKAENTAFAVTVTNPAPGGGESDYKLFTVTDDLSFTAPFAVVFGTNDYTQPFAATDGGGTIAVIFKLHQTGNSGDSILIIFSMNGGTSFDNATSVYQSQEQCHHPKFSFDSQGRLHTVFFTGRQLFYSSSADLGFNWSAPIPLSSPVLSQDEIIEPSIAIDKDDSIHVTWARREKGGNMAIFYSRSTGIGASWSQPVNVFTGWPTHANAYSPEISVDNNNGVYIAWTASTGPGTDEHVYVNSSHDSGGTWSASAVRFPMNTSPDIAVHPDGTLFLASTAQSGPGNSYISLYSSSDRGVNWSAGTAISTGQNSQNPRMEIDLAGNIDIVYRDLYSVIFKRSVDRGLTWFNQTEILRNTNTHPIEMAVDLEGNLVFVYSDKDEHGISYLSNSRYL